VSGQTLDLRTFLRLVKRHKILVTLIMLLGLAAGGAYSALKPPLLTTSALVVLPSSVRSMATQVVIAQSDPVLVGAERLIGPAVSLQTLQERVNVTSLTASDVISVTARATKARQAEQMANAVARSYVSYIGSASGPTGTISANVLQQASTASGESLTVRLATTALIGALIGVFVGAAIAWLIGHGDSRLRDRDEIADAIGVPVLASLRVAHPSDAGGWSRVLEDYRPSAVEALRLRTALHYLRRTDLGSDIETSIAVLSLSRDRGAVAIGPQIAAFAAALGIRTALVFGPQEHPDLSATLRTACAALEKRPLPVANLQVAVGDHHDACDLPDADLKVFVSVVDSQSPDVALTMQANETVLAVSSGVATAEDLARVAASALAHGRYLAGIFVADPDPADTTTGRIPQVARTGTSRMPTRVNTRSVEPRL
jgi:capsular polysaccharide biosynthesis protein